jgi:hypothetical protein
MTLPDLKPQPSLPTPSATPSTPPLPKHDTTGVLLFVYNVLGLAIMFGGAALILLSSLLQKYSPLPGMSDAAFLPGILLATVLVFCGALLIPPTIQAARRMERKPDSLAVMKPVRVVSAAAILVLWILVAGGAQLFEKFMNWAILPPLLILGVGLPIYLLIRVSTGGLTVDSRQRVWNIFGLGLVAGPALAGMLELIVYFVLLIGGTLYITANPQWATIYARIGTQLENGASIEQILSIVGPYLTSPSAIIVMLMVVSVAIPIIEELVKPVGVWMLKKRPPTPQEGFALGVLSGAGFALLESSVALASNNSGWGVAFLARIGGGIMHMLNTGLMGWAIASFWRERKFLRLAGMYGLVIFTHGLWNALTVMIVVGGLRVMFAANGTDTLGAVLTLVSTLGLFALAVGGLVALILFNRRMRLSLQPTKVEPAQSDIIAPPIS